MDDEVEQGLETIQTLIDTLLEFAVAYGFQILGALVFLLIGLKAAGWLGRRVTNMSLNKEINQTLAEFIGMIVKVLIIVILVIITLGNFGISIGPLVALAGAGAFGATMAIQGPLSNFGAGIGIILSRPFIIGNTITVGNASGVVEKIAMGATILSGEDGEQITIPNKEIVGRVIVNSQEQRVVQTKLAVSGTEDATRAITAIQEALTGIEDINSGAKPQVGVHDFTYGGVIVGARFWVPSSRYFQTRYLVNRTILDALAKQGIGLMNAGSLAMTGEQLSADHEDAIGD